MQLFCLLLGVAVTSGFIVPNEIPTVLSLVYSNIPPLKIGQDTRFGIGFRLGPHADFQTLIELGPQTNTGKLGPDETPAKRESVEYVPETTAPETVTVEQVEEEKPEKKFPKKASSPLIPKIPFAKVPGIDYR